MITSAMILMCICAQAQETNLYWGDTHLHTSNSMDAYFFANRDGTPEAAYRWAKGLPVINTANRTLIQIGTPLNFLVVSDHDFERLKTVWKFYIKRRNDMRAESVVNNLAYNQNLNIGD